MRTLIALFIAASPCVAAAQHTIGTRFAPPAGTTRVAAAEGSFAAYLRKLPLKAMGVPVLLYNGQPKDRQDVHAAVIDRPVGSRDLQQCADAVIRLRAEHLRQQGRDADIHFRFTNGFEARWDRWHKGERITVQGNTARWVPGRAEPSVDRAFEAYLNTVFTYAGTRSLAGELKDCGTRELQPGDVLIQGVSPGHAVLVVDVAVDAHGRRYAMLAQSYMPAQDIHVLRGPVDGVWYPFDAEGPVNTPEWSFRWSDRRCW
jgi:hypothetical protein